MEIRHDYRYPTPTVRLLRDHLEHVPFDRPPIGMHENPVQVTGPQAVRGEIPASIDLLAETPVRDLECGLREVREEFRSYCLWKLEGAISAYGNPTSFSPGEHRVS